MNLDCDPSHGYESRAGEYMSRRDPTIGVSVVRTWARELPTGGAVLDLGCGHGVPVSEELLREGHDVYGVDAAPTLVAAFRERFPHAHVVCETVERSSFFDRTFEGAVAWGVLFLLPPEEQEALIHRIASTLRSGGRFLFTSPRQACTWTDVLTGRQSVSLGAERYRGALAAAGLTTIGEYEDEGGNHYYDARKV